MLAVGGGVAFAFHLPVMIGLGGVAYAALVAWDLLGRQGPPPAPPPKPTLPDPEALDDPEGKDALAELLRARAALERARTGAAAGALAELAGPLSQVEDLERAAGELLRQSDALYRYLATQDLQHARKQLNQDRELAQRAQDAGTAEAYEKAASARESKVRALEALAQGRKRALAHVRHVAATLDALPPRLVQLQVQDRVAMERAGGDLTQDLDRLNQEVRLFEAALANLAQELPA